MVTDLFHYGHINLIKRAKYFKSLSDSDIHKNQNNYLIIGLRTDDCVEKYKRKPIISYEYRKYMLESCKYVDKVIKLDKLEISKEIIDKYKIDYVIHAHNKEENEKYNSLHFGNNYEMYSNKLIRLDYTQGISTTDIIKRIQNRYKL